MVDEKSNVVINSPETIAALEYAKQMYDTFVPGTLSWLDPNNNKAFLDGQIGLTLNGISIYYAAKNSQDPKIKEMVEDIGHANFPIGPVGKTTELKADSPSRDLLAPGLDKKLALTARSLDLRGESLTGTKMDFCLLSYTVLVECGESPEHQVTQIQFP